MPPEDLVFHKFYINKTSFSKKPKKKKKKEAVDDEAAEELYEVDGGDESDNDEIENMLDSANISLEANSNYDYNDLDLVANDDDADLVNASDTEMDVLQAIGGQGEEEEADDDSLGDVDGGDVYDGSDEDTFRQKKRKPKSRGKTGASPFASLEEYEHLLNEDNPIKGKDERKKQLKSKKKRKWSD